MIPEQRFFSKVDKTPTCWNWKAGLSHNGYGVFWMDGKNRRAHRVAFEAMVGPIPKGLEPDHLCKNPRCVNPDHLELVSRRVNLLRGDTFQAKNSKKTHCPHGHPLVEGNLVICLYKKGIRSCLTCRHEDGRRYRARKQNGYVISYEKV